MTLPELHKEDFITLKKYIEDHRWWSEHTFGEGDHLEGLLKHIESETREVREVANSKDLVLKELVDIVILAIDAMWRQGFYPDEIAAALIEKQAINFLRKFPKITSNDQPTEHVHDETDEECARCGHPMNQHGSGGCHVIRVIDNTSMACPCTGYVKNKTCSRCGHTMLEHSILHGCDHIWESGQNRGEKCFCEGFVWDVHYG